MVMAGRIEVIERLLAAHETWFDVERDHCFAGRIFPGYAEFHSSASQYVLVKRAKLWEASSHEYLFFWPADHLDEAALTDLLHFMTHEALGKVQLTSDHMSSYLSLVVVADEVDDIVPRLVSRARFRKNFALGLKGWADMRVAVVDLSARRIWANTQGKPLVETLAANAFAEDAPAAEGGKAAPVAAVADRSAADAEALAAEASAVRVSRVGDKGKGKEGQE